MARLTFLRSVNCDSYYILTTPQIEESKQETKYVLEEVHDNPFQIKIKKERATTLKQKAE